MERFCDRCERPLSDKYWLQVFHDDGSMQRTYRGEPPKSGRFVAVYIDSRCKKGSGGRRGSDMAPGDPQVELGKNVFLMDDIRIVREGQRFLMVVPKMIYA